MNIVRSPFSYVAPSAAQSVAMIDEWLFESDCISHGLRNRLFSTKNNISADDLAVLLAVVREGGFRAAALRLGVAPSNVSITVARIERQLGTPILRRTTRSLHLTDAGQLLVDRVSPLLSGLDAACHEVATLGGAL